MDYKFNNISPPMHYHTNYNLGFMNHECYSVPLSPVNNSNEPNEWMDDFLINSAPMTTVNSGSGLNNTPLQPSNLGNQPINFTQYFEEGSIFHPVSSSAETSYANSPENVYPEKVDTKTNNNISEPKRNKQNLNLETLEVLFNTKDILKQEPTDTLLPKRKRNATPVESSVPVSSNESSPMLSKTNTISLSPASSMGSSTSSSEKIEESIKTEKKSQPRTPKKRAPRKKLTDSQKKAHNKIEKRYRININAKIAGIQKIIPWVAYEKTAFETGEQASDIDANCARLNKSMILEKATDYILYLQQKEIQMTEENKRLKEQVLSLGGII
ncbi:uncharacterized protein SPAPADRAFT_61540 [Spathaspora passalidarum NRRL Y-27907]|uniref:Uncharacterized protein TYE7 n=1 Tax=Spathaspora passalidarum (strain NRRL Y-27907 / 11-Y1) TaxID=619300 RepID=G3AN88_SPAPN|nr:uncharacterized protein SPAPADRAFT_61540 [Spathaspora passalidarum NRRL Y-27907]EGW32471.1 hypothetical protein SPAPADRAFT_61540 [Spathaspora passalidarum NRRL Y-27907]